MISVWANYRFSQNSYSCLFAALSLLLCFWQFHTHTYIYCDFIHLISFWGLPFFAPEPLTLTCDFIISQWLHHQQKRYFQQPLTVISSSGKDRPHPQLLCLWRELIQVSIATMCSCFNSSIMFGWQYFAILFPIFWLLNSFSSVFCSVSWSLEDGSVVEMSCLSLSVPHLSSVLCPDMSLYISGSQLS